MYKIQQDPGGYGSPEIMVYMIRKPFGEVAKFSKSNGDFVTSPEPPPGTPPREHQCFFPIFD